MGTSSSVTHSTTRITQQNQRAALESLQKGCSKHPVVSSYIEDLDEFTRTVHLARALELLRMECEMDGEDLVNIGFAGGKNDLSHCIWPFIARFMAEGSAVTTRHETGELETVHFDEESLDYEDDEDDGRAGASGASEAADDFLSNMNEDRIDEEALDRLIADEGGIDFVDHGGRTPLIAACSHYRWAIERLRDAEEDGEDDDELEDSRQSLAIQQHNLRVILAKGPDMNRRERDRSDALGYAIDSQDAAFVEDMLARGAQVHAGSLRAAAGSLVPAIFDTVARHGAATGVQPGPEALVLACAAGSYEPRKVGMLRHLVETHKLAVNAPAAGEIYVMEGRLRRACTPLMAAALTDDVAAVQYLLQAGADVHCGDSYRNTALHYCSGQTWIGGDGQSLWFAREENPQVVQLLLQAGADPLAENAAGQSCIDIARHSGNSAAQALYANAA